MLYQFQYAASVQFLFFKYDILVNHVDAWPEYMILSSLRPSEAYMRQ